ncbi:PREDICTED: uncharacterized protein LOC109345804 isoform X2 [Lupinus angustifolius]|uniref:uncharacterized protein LOC109345804 isoform X2 n=1 Tax=Lupinus angustifolius TaxID=3871 RepID=UPI00092EFE46|nr:PREDICTED: uncharacterized protein LOC109345804 isoform X2 [Lupinus angustifolius]
MNSTQLCVFKNRVKHSLCSLTHSSCFSNSHIFLQQNKMELIQQNYNDNFVDYASNSPPSSPDICSIVGDPQLSPRLGCEYQVEVPSMIKQTARFQFQMNPVDSEVVHDNSLSFAIGLPISVMWIRSDVEDSGDNDGSTDNVIEPEKASSVKKSRISSQGDKSKSYIMAPGTLSTSWSDADARSFLLGLFIFGKNFIKIRRFLENKRMGEILSFYYGKFYKSDEYRRWSSCRKLKGRKCKTGEKLFTGLRQQELLSRLLPHVSEESRDNLLQVSKSYTEGSTFLEEYISSLKSAVGIGVLVEAVGIGKGKEDLTRLHVEPRKNNRMFPAPASKDWASLRPNDILNFLTGGFRLSKAKSNDLFWEAVWPRLLARGWHSEQPKNQGYVSTKDYLVFLTPGVKKFSRRKLVKGDQYFDCVTDVLSKVVSEPNLLELEEEAKAGSSNDEERDKVLNEDHQSDSRHHCYLKPRASTYNTDRTKFVVIDSSLVHGGKSSDLRKSKSLPGNSLDKVQADAAGITCKGVKHMNKASHKKDMSKSIEQKLTKFTVIDTSLLYKGKLLKVRKLRYLPVELEDASKMDGLSSKSKGSSFDDNSPCEVEAKMPIYGKKNISNTDCRKGISGRDATNKKEAFDNRDDHASKTAASNQNQKTQVVDDNKLIRNIKHQFSRRARSGHSNHPVPPIKRRRLTACVNDETNRVLENSSGCLGSEKLAFSRPLGFPDANKSVGDPFSHHQSESPISSLPDGSVGENNEESIFNEICRISRGKVEKCESQSPMPENGEMMAIVEEDAKPLKANDPCLTSNAQVVVEKPLRTSDDVGSTEQQPDINPRRQSTRNRPLTVRAMESLANEFFHEERKQQKRKTIKTPKDPFSPCRRARSKVKKMQQHYSSDHEAAVSVEEKHLKEDCSVSQSICMPLD